MPANIGITEADARVLKTLASVDNTLTLFGGSEIVWGNNKAMTIYYQSRLTSPVPNGVFSLHDLRHFISFIGLFRDPEIEFGEGSLSIVDGTGRTGSYCLSEQRYTNTVSQPIDIPASDVVIPLSKEIFSDWRKAAKIVGSEFSIISHTGLIQTRKGKEDRYTISMDIESPKKFVFALPTETIDMLENGEYHVHVNFQYMMVKFLSPDGSFYILPANQKKSNVAKS